MTNFNLPPLFIAFSTETTSLPIELSDGTTVWPDIISFGAVLVDQHSIVDRVNFLIKPHKCISPEASDATLQAEPTFVECAKDLITYLDNDIPLVTHWADFHWNVLVEQFKRCNINFDHERPLCLAEQYAINGQAPSFKELQNIFSIHSIAQVDDRLDASADAKTIALIALAMEALHNAA